MARQSVGPSLIWLTLNYRTEQSFASENRESVLYTKKILTVYDSSKHDGNRGVLDQLWVTEDSWRCAPLKRNSFEIDKFKIYRSCQTEHSEPKSCIQMDGLKDWKRKLFTITTPATCNFCYIFIKQYSHIQDTHQQRSSC